MALTVFDALSSALFEVRAELLIFIIALCTHAVLFGSYRWKPSQGSKTGKASKDVDGKTRPTPQPPVPGAAALIRSAKQLLRQGASRSAMADEFAAQIQATAVKDVCTALACMLEHMGRSVSIELIVAVRAVAHEQGLQLNKRLGEALLRSCLVVDLKVEIEEVLAEVEASGSATPAMVVLALRGALRASDLHMAMEYLNRFGSVLKAGSDTAPSSAQQQVAAQLIQLASKQAAIPAMLREFVHCGLLTPGAIEVALKECTAKPVKEGSQAKEVEKLASLQGVELTDAACAAIVRATGTAEDASRVFSDAVKRGAPGKELLLTVLNVAKVHSHGELVEAVLQHVPRSPTPEIASALLRAVGDGPSCGKAQDVAILRTYEKHMAGVDVLADMRAGRLLADAAIRQNRLELLAKALAATSDSRRHVTLIKSFSTEQRYDDARKVFQACPEKTVCLYNALMAACVDCQDLEGAEKLMAEATAADKADVVTYNTLIKKHLQRGNFSSARSLLEAMRSAGGSLAPNSVTFNELLDAAIRTGSQGVWLLIDEMKACGVEPNNVTCSILLKGVQQFSKAADVERTLSYVDTLEESTDLDEVLVSSMCEACIRAGRLDLLAKQLRRQEGSKAVQLTGAQTFGSLIRSYGVLKDLRGAWEMWGQMRKRKIALTSITIGCMVEALVTNGDPEAGFQLIHELTQDAETRPLINAVIYCSVLKGFTHQKQFERVWLVYEEMVHLKLQFTIVTYNALIDACARAGDMRRVQSFLHDMAKQNIEPNVVTYSTIVKGYCQEGCLDKAFELMEAMKKSKHFRPDEITYNTLIDGCAQRNMFDQGMKLLDEMQESGVAPSNFTLSVVVKLANRGNRPARAFELVEQLTRKYYLQLNVHVYNNLVHACTNHGDARKALQVLEKMARQRVRPDVRTYTLLLRGCVEAREFQEAAGLVRLACGLRGAQLPPRLANLSSEAHLLQLRGGLSTDLLSEVLEAMAGRGGEERLAVTLCKELRSAPGIRLDPKLAMALTSRAICGTGAA
mmetsp:Transcript_77027/g.237831  ORF Transcript_77027/g.237831 Transcript_77027/m.237831 type:complete len:1025 (+) Transcript_77027:111-3185(+)